MPLTHRCPQASVWSLLSSAGLTRAGTAQLPQQSWKPLSFTTACTMRGAKHIVILTEAGRHAGFPNPGLLSSIFDLTLAETRLADALIGINPCRVF